MLPQWISGTLQFDGIEDYANAGFILNPSDGPFSVFAWIKGGAPGQVVISQTDGANWLLADPSEGKLCEIDPFEYLRDVLDRISTHPAKRIVELTPSGWKS